MPEPPPAATPDLSGLVLRGVLLREGNPSAIIETPDGRQRLVRQGALVVPGVRLAGIMAGAVELDAGDDTVRLALDSESPAAGTSAPARITGKARPEEMAASVSAWRLALGAVRTDGRITGWRVRDTSQLPLLQRAAMVPGDILLSVNDLPLFSEEKVMDLPGEIAGAYAVTLEYSRDGRARRVTIALER